MTTNTNPISVTYSDEKLRILVEEYITMQKKDFTFKGICSYILYRAKEEEKTSNKELYESDQLDPTDSERVRSIMETILREKRIELVPGNELQYSKQ